MTCIAAGGARSERTFEAERGVEGSRHPGGGVGTQNGRIERDVPEPTLRAVMRARTPARRLRGRPLWRWHSDMYSDGRAAACSAFCSPVGGRCHSRALEKPAPAQEREDVRSPPRTSCSRDPAIAWAIPGRKVGLSLPDPGSFGCAPLSGGEAQRIRLASQLGNRLVGVLYVLDEPTIGLHPRDTQRLLRDPDGPP